MRHRIKKDPMSRQECCDVGDKLNRTLNHKLNLLHSDKRTYFYKHSKLGYSSTIPLVLASLVLLLVLGYMVNPVGIAGNSGGKVYATTSIIPGDGGTSGSGGNDSGSDSVTPSISLTLPGYTAEDEKKGITLQKELPTKFGDVESSTGYVSIDFNVEAKQLDKYDIYVQSSSSSLIGNTNKGTIASISSDMAYTDLKTQSGKWGYAVVEGASVNPESMTYKPIRTDANTSAIHKEATSGTLTENQAYTLAFAANLTGATADHYESNIILSVAAGAGEVAGLGFAGAIYMQDINKTFCDSNSIPIGTEGRVIDSRDGKLYWIAKLKDGRCWMTQNLAYDIPGTDSKINWGQVDGGANYYNPGKYVYTTPTNANQSCGNANGLQNCISKGWQSVDSTWKVATESNYGQIVDIANKIYNAHYLSGNYYAWSAAKNVCPGGWKLPEDGDYNALFTSYGANSGLKYGDQDIRLYPLSFVYGGYVNNGPLTSAGSEGRYWSSTSASATDAYSLNFSSSTVYPSGKSYRYLGNSVRCVAI